MYINYIISISWAISCTIVLQLLEVEDVYDVLRREHYRWFIIGKALGIRDEIMNSISEDSLGHTDECLKGVIREWIKHRNSSWLTLANALQNEHIPRDLYDIAGHIMDTKGIKHELACADKHIKLFITKNNLKLSSLAYSFS